MVPMVQLPLTHMALILLLQRSPESHLKQNEALNYLYMTFKR